MDQIIELLSKFATCLRDLLSLVLLEDGQSPEYDRIELEKFVPANPNRVWAAFGVSLIFSSVVIVACRKAADKTPVDISKVMEIDVGAIPMVLSPLVASVFFTLIVGAMLVLSRRKVSKWALLGIWAAATAPWMVVASLGYGLVVFAGSLPDSAIQSMYVFTGIGVTLLVVSGVFAVWRGSTAMTRYVVRSACRSHVDRPCPVWCKAWAVALTWIVPALVGILLYMQLTGRSPVTTSADAPSPGATGHQAPLQGQR